MDLEGKKQKKDALSISISLHFLNGFIAVYFDVFFCLAWLWFHFFQQNCFTVVFGPDHFVCFVVAAVGFFVRIFFCFVFAAL